MIRHLVIWALSLCAACTGVARAQALPVSTVGNAVFSGITSALVRRGFTAADVRVAGTVSQVSSRLMAVAAANDASFSWLSAMARLAPIASTALLVGTAVYWLWSADGSQVTVVDKTGIVLGSFNSGDLVFKCGPGTVYTTTTSGCIAEALYRDGKASITNIVLPSTIDNTDRIYRVQYKLSGDTAWRQDVGTWAIAKVPAPYACPSGRLGLGSGGCFGAIQPSTFIVTTPVYAPVQSAAAALPNTETASQVSPQTLAELANRLWKDAASQPSYTGQPWASTRPVTESDFSTLGSSAPTVADLTKPVPAVDPVSASDAASTPSPSASQAIAVTVNAKVDLGPDPGVTEPSLPQAPDFFKPVHDFVASYLSWSVPSHESACPIVDVAPTVGGQRLAVNSSDMCDLLEKQRSTVSLVAAAMWSLLSVLIVLEA